MLLFPPLSLDSVPELEPTQDLKADAELMKGLAFVGDEVLKERSCVYGAVWGEGKGGRGVGEEGRWGGGGEVKEGNSKEDRCHSGGAKRVNFSCSLKRTTVFLFVIVC